MRSHRPSPGRSSGRLHTLALLTFATAATAGLSSTATAAVTGTSITSPTSYQVLDANLGQFTLDPETTPEFPEYPQTHVTGTATTSGADDNAVQVFVVIPLKRLGGMMPIIPIDISEPIPVGPDGSFAVDVNTPPINSRIVALPVDVGSEEQALPAFFDEGGPFRPTTVLGGIAASASLPGLGNFSLALRGQRQGFGLIAPAGFADFGVEGSPISSFGALGGVTSGVIGSAEGDFALNFLGAAGISSRYNAARGGLTVNGARAYLRDHIPVGTDVLPAPTMERKVDFQTGGQTVVQTQDVYLAADAADNPNIVPLEGGYRASGLQLQRTSVQDHDGRQISVTDRFRSTNGAAHKIDVLYAEGLTILPYDAYSLFGGGGCGIVCLGPQFEGPLAGLNPASLSSLAPLDESEDPEFPTFEPPAFRIPWETGAQWETRSHADAMTAPSTATSTVFTRLPNASALFGAFLNFGEEGETPAIPSTYGAITYGTRPDAGLFLADPLTIGMILGGTSTQYVSRFVRNVPAGGDTTIAQVYSTGTTQAEVEALAAAAEKRLAPAAPAPTPTPTPVAPPAPPTPAVARKAPSKLSTASKLQRTKSGQYRFRFTGRLTLPSGVAKSACRAGGGTVTLQIKAGANTISTRRVKLDRNCKYAVRINFRSRARFGNRTRLTVIAKWSGNRVLGPKPAKRFTVRVR